jgi:hypothetical protein
MAKQDDGNQAGQEQNQEQEAGQIPDEELTSRIGPVEIDWPQSIGYFGALGVATALGFIEPPLAIFIAAVPFFKFLNQPDAPRPTRFVGQVLEGASKPVGSDGSATIRPNKERRSQKSAERQGFMLEARSIANRFHNGSNGSASKPIK